MGKIRKPLLEKANIITLRDSAQKIYDEIIQWNRWENSDTSNVKHALFSCGMDIGDMAYHGWIGEPAQKEREKFNALYGAYQHLLATVEDLLGIKKEEFKSNLNDNGEIRYQIIDTKRED